jgi:hypothetical protein
MMLMVPNVYREMARVNAELGKAVTILSLNGLHPLNTGARVSFGKGKPTVTDGPFIETTEVPGGYWQVFDEANFAIKK